MAERLFNVLTSLCTPALEIRLETLTAIVEEAAVLICKLPECLKDHVSEIEQKISDLSDRLDAMGHDITDLRPIEDVNTLHPPRVSPINLRNRMQTHIL